MEDFEVIQQAKDGDFSALEKWMDIYGPKIARFSFQCGSTLAQACEVAQETFRTFQNELETIYGREQVLPALYKIAIEKLPSVQKVTPRQEGLFMFEEDAELHSELMNLDEKHRVPLILRLFHGFDVEQIAEIIDSPLKEVEEWIQFANEMLEIEIGKGHLEKRLGLLGKSYERLPVQFQAEHIIRKAAFSERKIGKRRKKLNGKMLVIASVFLIGILFVQFFLPKKGNEQAARDPFMNELEEKYKAERTVRQDELRLDDNRFSSLNFIKVADDRMDALETLALIDKEAELEKLISSIKLPAEMVEDIVENPLNQDEEASIAYLGLYRDRVNDLIAVYNQILWDYREPIESFEVNPFVKKEEILLLTSNKFPEELQNIFDTMEKQSIKLCVNNNTGLLHACYSTANSYMKMQDNLHFSVSGYLNMLVNEPYSVDAKKMALNFWEYGSYLSTIQNTLVTVAKDNKLYPVMESYFVSLLYEIIKGSEFTKVFNDEGTVKYEFNQTWVNISHGPAPTPINYLVHPILAEMESSGWRHSESWELFDHDKIKEALELARNGKLETIMYGERPVVEDHLILLPDEDFSTRIVELYLEFKKSYDKTIFKGLSPIYIVGVFDYANEMEDSEMMYHLFHENAVRYTASGDDLTLEWYVSNWRKGFSLFKDATRIEFYAEEMNRFDHEYYEEERDRFGKVYVATVRIFANEMHNRWVYLILDEDEKWHLHETWLRPLPSTEEEPETTVNNAFIDRVKVLYEEFRKYKEIPILDGFRAIDIVGIYFYAAEVGDFETQYAFLFNNDNYPFIEKEEYLIMKESSTQGKMEDLFKSISFKGMGQNENGDWPGVATLYVDIAKNPGEKPEKSFQMMWTRDGWRVLFMPME